MGATGHAIWVDVGGHQNRISLDDGRTWQDGTSYPENGHVTAVAGRFASYGGDDGMAIPRSFAAATPREADTFEWEDDGRRLEALGTRAALWTNGLLSTVNTSRETRWPTLREGPDQYLFSADSAWLVRIVRGNPSDQLSVAPVPSGVGGAPLEVPAALDYAVGPTGLHALVKDGGGLATCLISLPDGARSCATVWSRPVASASLHQAGDIGVLNVDGSGYLIENGRTVEIALPDSTRDWSAEGAGDPVRPLLRVTDAAGVHHVRVAADGSIADALVLPR